MTEADDLARRFLDLWGEYLAALFADPAATGSLRRWLDADLPIPPELRSFLQVQARRRDEPVGGERQDSATGPAARTAAAAGASGERDDALAELARRLAEAERRLAALEAERGGDPGSSGRDGRTTAADRGRHRRSRA